MRRFNVRIKAMKLVDEGHWQRFRIQWADFRNANGSKCSPQDLIKLNCDTETPEDDRKPLTPKEVKEMLGSRIRNVS